MTDKVLARVDADGTATVTLNRPELHNAFDPEMVDALTATLARLDGDDAVRAVVLTGAGRSFCAGADIDHMKRTAGYSREQNLESARATALMLSTLARLGKPTIACVRGAARGGGVGLVSACDMAIAARGATFRLSEVKLGIIPAMISPFVIRAIGQRQAHRYLLTGEEFDATEACRIGLVHQVCEEPELDAAVGRLIAELRSSGPQAMAAIKALMAEIGSAPADDGVMEKVAQRIAAIRVTPEAQEGLSAFLEKRRAAWSRPLAASPGAPGSRSAGKSER